MIIENVFIFALPRKRTYRNINPLNLRFLKSGKFGEFGNFDKIEKFCPDGQYAYLYHEVINAKSIAFIFNKSQSTAYRLLTAAKVKLGLPDNYELTLGEFCTCSDLQRPAWFAYRLWLYKGGKN